MFRPLAAAALTAAMGIAALTPSAAFAGGPMGHGPGPQMSEMPIYAPPPGACLPGGPPCMFRDGRPFEGMPRVRGRWVRRVVCCAPPPPCACERPVRLEDGWLSWPGKSYF